MDAVENAAPITRVYFPIVHNKPLFNTIEDANGVIPTNIDIDNNIIL